MKKSLYAAGLAVAFVLVPTAAQALDCVNVSKPPAECGSTCTEGPIIKGNWAWLPSVFPGAPQVWAFVPPGTVEGYALLVNAICDSTGGVLEHRQTGHGIQLLEGCP